MNTIIPCFVIVFLFFAFFGNVTASGNETTPGNGTAPGNGNRYTNYGIRKCCPPDRAYDPGTRYCRRASPNVDEKFQWLLARSAKGMTITNVHQWSYCNDPRANVLANVPADEVQRLLDNATGTDVQELPNDHCFDLKWSLDGENNEGQLVARKCKSWASYCHGNNITCVRKCCARENKMIIGDSCVETEIPFQYPIHVIGDSGGGDMTRSNNTLVTYYQLPTCQKHRKIESDFILTVNGSLYLTETGTYLSPGEFCMENYQPIGSEPELSAFACKIGYSRSQWNFSDDYWKYAFLLAGFVPSVLCLFLTLLVYTALPTLRNVHGYYVMCYVTCMLVSVICLMVIQWLQSILDDTMCKFFGYSTFFGFLVTFCWLSVICFDIYWTLRHNHSTNRKNKIPFRATLYHIYCWGFSSICVVTAFTFQFSENKLLMKLSPNIGISSCWFQENDYGYAIFYILPVSTMLIFNMICFVLTAIHCARIKSEINKFKQNDSKKELFQAEKEMFAVSIKLFLVMGIPWTFEMINKALPKTWIILQVFDEINAFQGVMIFFIFVVKKRVISDLRKKFGNLVITNLGESTKTTGVSRISLSN